jgi:SulP family sulfate permease
MCTVMAGILLVVMGATGMGTGVKFLPRPVVIGFTNGIVVLIASTQIKDFFGLQLEKVPGVFWLRMKALAASSPTWSLTATVLAAATVAAMLLCRILSKRIPGPIVAMLGATIAVFSLKLPVETIGTRFGGIPSGLPHMVIPRWHAGLVHGLLGPAFTVAMLGAIESLMSAVVSDRMSNDRHNPNVELIGQGVANIMSAMFGGAAGYRRDRSHCHEHSLGSAVTGCRHDSFVHASVRAAVCCAAGQLHSNGRASRNSDDRGLQHG